MRGGPWEEGADYQPSQVHLGHQLVPVVGLRKESGEGLEVRESRGREKEDLRGRAPRRGELVMEARRSWVRDDMRGETMSFDRATKGLEVGNWTGVEGDLRRRVSPLEFLKYSSIINL